MSNSHLFLKSGFPRAPLSNGLGRYICQLKRITLKYCKNNGSSGGMRNFLENNLVDFAKSNPSVVVYVKPRRHRTPVIVAEYLNGDRQWINCRNNTQEEIIKWVNLMRTQTGDSSSVRWRKLWHTDSPSIQGPWTPFLHKNPSINLDQFPNQVYSKPIDVEETATDVLMKLLEKQKLSDADQNQPKEVADGKI